MNGSDYNCDKLSMGSTHGGATPRLHPTVKKLITWENMLSTMCTQFSFTMGAKTTWFFFFLLFWCERYLIWE